MAHPKYTGTYLAIRRAWAPIVARGEATCHEPVCLHPTRDIHPDARWDLSHDPSGTVILGPSHRRCNRAEGATRGNKARPNRYLTL